MNPIIQCVPNFSEGRNPAIVESIIKTAEQASSARVIDYSFDPDHNRMVVTLLGNPEEIHLAMFAAASRAVELIDLRSHTGAHPRIGAVDVVPLVPIQGITMDECVELSHRIGEDIGRKLGVPVYYYEQSAVKSNRINLPDIRKGGFERLVSEGTLAGNYAPDAGPNKVHPSAGAMVVGARGPLVAYNINLDSQDMEIARAIVKKMRGGEAGLEGVRSMSVFLTTRSMAQVSMNITRPDVTPMRDVYRFVETDAKNLGVEVAESEIIGVVLQRFLDGTSPEELKAVTFKDSQILDNWL